MIGTLFRSVLRQQFRPDTQFPAVGDRNTAIIASGRPVIRAVRDRDKKSGRWENTRYTVLPISQLAIFDAEPELLDTG